MQTVVLSTGDAAAIPVALQVLKAGGLVAFPTDTVYGLAADLFNPQAIDRIFEAKDRDMSKAVAVLLATIEQLEQVAQGISPQASKLAARFWPGALTLVLARKAGLPDNLSALPTIGVRMPDHAFARRLLTAAGPLATTSANRSGMPDATNAGQVLAQLDGRVDLVLDGGDSPGGVPSTVVDCTGADIRILRQGAIPAEEIFRLL